MAKWWVTKSRPYEGAESFRPVCVLGLFRSERAAKEAARRELGVNRLFLCPTDRGELACSADDGGKCVEIERVEPTHRGLTAPETDS